MGIENVIDKIIESQIDQGNVISQVIKLVNTQTEIIDNQRKQLNFLSVFLIVVSITSTVLSIALMAKWNSIYWNK